jgi:hypothetical protein
MHRLAFAVAIVPVAFAPQAVDAVIGVVDPGSANPEAPAAAVVPVAFAPQAVDEVIKVVDPGSAAQVAQERGNLPDNDHARGLVFDGLEPGAPGGPCAGGYELEAGGETLCTHGPDAAPADVDVRTPVDVDELRSRSLDLRRDAAAPAQGSDLHVHDDGTLHDHSALGDVIAEGDGSGTAAATGGVPIIGDGVSGNRVQAVYAVAADRTDRYDEVAPLITEWAAHVNTMVAESAALTGGERHVRFVTDSGGTLAVEKVILPTTGDDSFNATISAMKAAGYDDPSRKYLIWTDASSYCGIATIYGDDRAGQDNANNGRYPMYSRVDSGCWGFSNSVELHEIVHNMGGVQQSAPHVTPGWHCTDDADRMCYKDSSTVTMTSTCPSWMEAYLDCGHDDYFHTSPPAGSYLAQHWNVANSSFLHAGSVGDPQPPPPPPTNEAPKVSASAAATVEVGISLALNGTVSDDGLPSGTLTTGWSQTLGSGTATFTDATAVDTTVTFDVAGTYELVLTANDGELTGSAAVTVTVENPPPPPGPTTVTETFSGSLNKRWPARTFDTTVADGAVTATVQFDGGRGKKASSAEMTVALYDATGTRVASVRGPSGVQLTATVSAGTYTWEVSGTSTSFTLEVNYLR